MNEQKHTPGERWVAATDDNKFAVGIGDAEIAVFTNRGDAMLDKAASDLLTALEGIRDSSRGAAKQFRLLGNWAHAALWDAHADAADAAIAKARGQ